MAAEKHQGGGCTIALCALPGFIVGVIFCGSVQAVFPGVKVPALAVMSFLLFLSAIMLSREFQLHALAGLSLGAMFATAIGALVFTICGG